MAELLSCGLEPPRIQAAGQIVVLDHLDWLMNASERRYCTLPFLFLLLVLLALPGCTKRQVEVTASDSHQSDAPAGAEAQDVETGAAPQPDYFAEQRMRAAEALDRDARRLVDAGRVQVYRGRLEDAQVYFDEALNLLDQSGFSFDDYPFLETANDELESEIRRIEVLAAVRRCTDRRIFR